MSLPASPFIFVSYSSKDSRFVHSEITRLERQGYKVWYDKGRLQPGRIWVEEIRQAIEECACFIVFMSEAAVNSKHVCDEIEQALKADKHFICIYWEKVELPPRFRETLRSVQALERYSMHRDEYEEPLARALAEYIKKPEPTTGEHVERLERESSPPPPHARPDMLPKIVFFALILSAGTCLFLTFVMVLIPYFASPFPGDPFNNRLAGLVTGIFFLLIAVGLSVGAFGVYRVYLRRKDG
jgi:hypothetical protein